MLCLSPALSLFASGALALSTAVQSNGATAANGADALDAAARQSITTRIGELLEQRYVFPDKALASRKHLAAKLADGAFDAYDEATAFADALTDELQSVTKDKHLRVFVRPPREETEEVEVEPEHPKLEEARRLDEMRRDNFGFARVERLDGNIGYVDMRFFAPPVYGQDTAVAAMAFVENCDALIFDMRQNGGGSPGMVQFVCSHLFAEPVHLNSLYWRAGDRTQEFWSLPGVPGKQMPDVPVFVLTSDYTFSGAEEFTYNLQTQNRATIIGETTGGGAHPGGHVMIDERFGMFVPSGRAINPITGTNWEGTGVTPDIAVDADKALDRALEEARPAAQAFGEARLAKRIALLEKLLKDLDAARAHIDAGRIDEGSTLLAQVLRTAVDERLLDEFEINRTGYDFIDQGCLQGAVAIFRFNTVEFPHSANAWDSLGEAYAAVGEIELAIENYAKSVELDPSNEHGKQRIEELKKRAKQ